MMAVEGESSMVAVAVGARPPGEALKTGSAQRNGDINGVGTNSNEPTAGDAALERITQRLEDLNLKVAEQKAQKAETVMPANAAQSAAGNAAS